MTELYTLKFAPKKLTEVIGQKRLKTLKLFIKNYKPGTYLLISGPTGTGKTSSIYAIARELDLELIELNSSDLRNKKSLNSLLGNVISQQSLFNKQKVILIDEIEGISGRSDYGGLATLSKFLKNSSTPIILTCIDAYEDKFKKLRKKSMFIEFLDVDYQLISNLLKTICRTEDIFFEKTALDLIAKRSGGDVRASLIDLQTLSLSGKVLLKDVKQLDGRKQTEKIKDALFKIFKHKDESFFRDAFENVNIDHSEAMLWLEENIPDEYQDNKEIAIAFDYLSKADVLSGRIRKRQYWRLLYYIHQFLTMGVALSKKKGYDKQIDYKRGSRILKIWISNRKNMKRNNLAKSVANKLHLSKNRFIQDVYYYFKLFEEDKQLFEKIKNELDFE